MQKILAGLVTVALVTGCAAAAGELAFPSVDADDSDSVSQAEFGEFLNDIDAFARYDDNGDGELNMEEYREAVAGAIESGAYFRGFDRDRSGGLDMAEFTNGIFGVYDTNGDGWMNESEFEGAVAGLSMEM